MINTDICIIGAGPVGLFAVFEAGLLKMRCHVVDVLPQIGGQLTEIYPKKPIYDIPGFPEILAQDLIKNLRAQIDTFNPTFTLGERVESLAKLEDESFALTTSEGTQIFCKIVVIAGGLGCFEPRKPPIPNIEKYEGGKGIQYMITDPEKFRNKRIVIAGGGDSALDWTNYLAEMTSELILVHRNESFRGAPDSAEKVLELAKEGKIKLMLNSNVSKAHGETNLTSVSIEDKDKVETVYETDYFIPLFGLTPKLGPIADWSLNIDKNAIEVNTYDYSTNIKGIFAIGDINTYDGKLKLILCGFHEAALMAQSAFKILNPNKKFTLKYTTVNGVESF